MRSGSGHGWAAAVAVSLGGYCRCSQSHSTASLLRPELSSNCVCACTFVQAFLHTLTLLRGQPGPEEIDLRKMGGRAFGASVAALGLTNKAVFEEAAGVEEAEDASQPGEGVVACVGMAVGSCVGILCAPIGVS